jgi:hypothetical protein
MKRLPLHFPKVDIRSLAFQTSLELALGGLFAALLIRWIGW